MVVVEVNEIFKYFIGIKLFKIRGKWLFLIKLNAIKLENVLKNLMKRLLWRHSKPLGKGVKEEIFNFFFSRNTWKFIKFLNGFAMARHFIFNYFLGLKF